MTEVWTTRLPPEATAAYGVDELHAVVFQPRNDPGGDRFCVAVHIPESTPPEIIEGLKMADTRKARLLFLCDTAEQAASAAALACTLPRHIRVPLERAHVGAWALDRRH